MALSQSAASILFIFCLVTTINAQSGQQAENPPGALPPPPPPFDDGVPPGFELVLPKDVIQQLKDLNSNAQMTRDEKREQFDKILESVPGDVLVKLPFPPGFYALPSNVREQLRAIHLNPKLGWIEKSKKIAEIIDALPDRQRMIFMGPPPGGKPPNFPLMPPPGFEEALPPATYDELLEVHQDPNMSKKEKALKIDSIMRKLDQSTIDKLPLPPGFNNETLTPEQLKQFRAVFFDMSVDFETRNKNIIKFVKSLPPDVQEKVKQLPPVLSQLPKETRDKIDAVFNDEHLSNDERDAGFWKIVNSLPPKERNAIHQQLGDGGEDGALPISMPANDDVSSPSSGDGAQGL